MNRTLPQRLWALCCSLKLAIVLASLATLLTMGGSLLVHYLPAVFGDLDQHTLATWFRISGLQHPALASWLVLLVLLMVLLGINTLCCFVDWLGHLRARWRKTGEYLLHLGFVLILTGYLWGALAGHRQPGQRLFEGQTVAVAGAPGDYLRLERFEPVIRNGRPVDMRSTVTLLRGDTPLTRAVLHINHPLVWQDLVILPESFGQQASGFLFRLGDGRTAELETGSSIDLGHGRRLQVLDFLPDAWRAGGRVVPRSEGLGNPALELELREAGQVLWHGWYFLRQGLPPQLAAAGDALMPLQPRFKTYSVLTINTDPGAHLALTGAGSMLAGVLLALVSFYRKRSRGDRPDIT